MEKSKNYKERTNFLRHFEAKQHEITRMHVSSLSYLYAVFYVKSPSLGTDLKKCNEQFSCDIGFNNAEVLKIFTKSIQIACCWRSSSEMMACM